MVYKVCILDYEESKPIGRSATNNALSSLSLTYRIGERTYAKVGRLFVFRSLRDAYDFIPYSPEYSRVYSIYRCNSDTLYRCHIVCNQFTIEDIVSYWKAVEQGSEFSLAMTAPSGTYTTRWVEPITEELRVDASVLSGLKSVIDYAHGYVEPYIDLSYPTIGGTI